MKPQSLRDRLRETTTNAILEATEQVAAKDGVAATSLQAIAKKAGVAVGTLYNYFGDKKDLLDALFKVRREEMYDAIDVAAKRYARASFEEQLAAFVRSVFVHFDGRRAFLRIAFESESRPQVVKGADGRKMPATQQLSDRAERVIRTGMKEKALRDADAAFLATVLAGIIKSVLLIRSQDEEPIERETDRVVALFLNGAAR